MGILDFLSNNKSKRSPEEIWDEYISNYLKKYDLAINLRNLIIKDKNNPNLSLLIIGKILEMEKLIPNELVELSEEEFDLETIQKHLDVAYSKEDPHWLEDSKYIIEHHEHVVENPNELLRYMKEVLELLAQIIKKEYSLIKLIKKDPTSEIKVLKLFNLITNNENYLTKIFGSELRGKDYKKRETMVTSALTNKRIAALSDEEKQELSPLDYHPKSAQRKKRLDIIIKYYNELLMQLNESNNFEVFYNEINLGLSLTKRPVYGIYIRPKNYNKFYLVETIHKEDLDRKMKNEGIIKKYESDQNYFKDRLKQGIRILKKILNKNYINA